MPLSISEDSQQHTQGNESVINQPINISADPSAFEAIGEMDMDKRRQSHPIQVETEIRYKVKE